MKLAKSILILCIINSFHIFVFSQNLGIDNMRDYLPLLKNKNVGIVVNYASQINDTHLIDTLSSLGIEVSIVFSPEHGFSGNFNAGEYVSDSYYNDSIPIVSLYGSNKKLSISHLKNIDLILFDIQDVGVRFYTYISTLHYVMEACAQEEVSLILLDRPNPHTHYVDGPVLDMQYSSFVGMHPVPIVYGMTIGEYALMINGEQWLSNGLTCNLNVIKLTSYSRFDIIDIALPPSPNLKTMNSILLYPSLCLFEGTLISVGRGTDSPFEMYGAPFFRTSYVFNPEPNFGSRDPKYNGELCYGFKLKSINHNSLNKINLEFLMNAYNNSSDYYRSIFFNNFFNKLAGNENLKFQIINNFSEDEIRKTWEKDIQLFLLIRDKYLLYD